MAVLNAVHLLEQAERLMRPPPAGPPRQVDLRRAVSASYYSVFHHVLTTAADDWVGVTKRSSKRYAHVYRSIDHRTVREICAEAGKTMLPARLRKYAPDGGLGPDIAAFALVLIDLQEQRHAADYDPSVRLRTEHAAEAVEMARGAIRRFGQAGVEERKAFLALLLFPAR